MPAFTKQMPHPQTFFPAQCQHFAPLAIVGGYACEMALRCDASANLRLQDCGGTGASR
jgi:hypothetical protein